MDPAIFMTGVFNSYSLGFYLGLTASETLQQKELSHQQGLKLLEHYDIIPKRDVLANCPICGAPLGTITDRARYGWIYRCLNHDKRKRFSPLDNTFLARFHLNGEISADKVVLIIDMWLNREPVINAQNILSVTEKTAISWYGFCRDVACAIAWHDYTPIGGSGDVVEVDESQLFKQRFSGGRVTKRNAKWVVGGISRITKKIFAVIIEEKNTDTLIPVLQQCIDGNSYICSDLWRTYGECENFTNSQINEEPFENHTRKVKRALGDLKKYLSNLHSVRYSSQYIGEWMYRKNVLSEIGSKKGIFQRFLRDIRRAYPGIGKTAMKKQYVDLTECDCHECE